MQNYPFLKGHATFFNMLYAVVKNVKNLWVMNLDLSVSVVSENRQITELFV